MPKLVITEEMLDAIEAVKGVRDPNYWDPNCKRYMESQQKSKKDVKTSEKSYSNGQLMNITKSNGGYSGCC